MLSANPKQVDYELINYKLVDFQHIILYSFYFHFHFHQQYQHLYHSLFFLFWKIIFLILTWIYFFCSGVVYGEGFWVFGLVVIGIFGNSISEFFGRWSLVFILEVCLFMRGGRNGKLSERQRGRFLPMWIKRHFMVFEYRLGKEKGQGDMNKSAGFSQISL